MENLVVVALFIIFAIVRKIIEQRNKAPSPRETKGKLPSTEGKEDVLKAEPFRETAYEGVNKARDKIPKKISRGRDTEEFDELGVAIGSQGEGKKKKTAVKSKSYSRLEKFSGGVVQGIIYSEILGTPRARKPFPIKQVNKL